MEKKREKTNASPFESEHDISSMDSVLFEDPILLLDYLQKRDGEEISSNVIQEVEKGQTKQSCDQVRGNRKKNNSKGVRRDLKKAPYSKFAITHCFGVYDHEHDKLPFFSLNDCFIEIKGDTIILSMIDLDLARLIRKNIYFTVAPIAFITDEDGSYIGISQTIDLGITHDVQKARKIDAPFISFCPIVFECAYTKTDEDSIWSRKIQAKFVNAQAVEEAIEDNQISIEKVFGIKEVVNTKLFEGKKRDV